MSARMSPVSLSWPPASTRNVDDRDDAAHHRRKLDEAALVEILALERRVGRAEIDRLRLDLLNSAAGTDRLVVQAVPGLFLVGFGPLG